MSPRTKAVPSCPYPRETTLGPKERETLFNEKKAVAAAALDKLANCAALLDTVLAKATAAYQDFVDAQKDVLAAGLPRGGDALAIIDPALEHALSKLRPGGRRIGAAYKVPSIVEAVREAKVVLMRCRHDDK